MNKKTIVIILLSLLLFVSVGFNVFSYNKLQEKLVNNQEQKEEFKNNLNNIEIANPASTNCITLGGTLKINKNGIGSEYGLCYFEENRACEEWALLRGECPLGGRKTTGYNTESQRYCAWLGGETLAQENAKCTFNDGSICDDEDLYNGKCAKGDSLK